MSGTSQAAGPTMDAVRVEVLWSRLISIVNEQAAALMHASFTTVVREAGDLSAGVFDRQGNMLAQAVTGTPGHINTMATGVRHFVQAHPIDSLAPGDSLLTNDPWLVSGHLHDITVVTPVFHKGRGIGWFANTCHAMDIGGRTLGADAREVFEEGLAIPIMPLFRAGVINDDLVRIVRANVREPDAVVGDLYAQQAGNDVGAAKLVAMLEEYRLDDIEALGAQILARSEQAAGDAIEALRDGSYTDEVEIDGFDEPLVIRLTLTVRGRHLLADYEGTSAQVDRGINVVFNYTHAYTTYPLTCAIHPQVPNNEGSFRPLTVRAPEGSILNTQRPSAVGARHLIGHFLSQAVFGALSRLIPERVIADGSAGLWNTQLEGRDRSGRLFAYIYFSAGGMGARPNADGLSATAFPSGIRGVPAEAIESVSPTLMLRRALRPDSGGAGTFRGGLGQEMVLAVDSDAPTLHSPMYDRTRSAARGFAGGGPGALGEMVLDDGTALHPKRKYLLPPGRSVTLRLPGGGGYGPAVERDPQRVLEDVRQGRVSPERARTDYGVAVDTATWQVDAADTERLRAALRAAPGAPPPAAGAPTALPSDRFTDVLAAFPEPPSPAAACGDAAELTAWQQRFREQLRGLRGWVPARVAPAAEVLAEVEAPDHRRLTVRIAVSEITSVVAYLLLPASSGGGRRPGLVALHGHYRHGIDTICGVRVEADDPDNDERHAYGLHAVRAGYVVVAPALWGWPGRDGHLDRVGGRDRCNTIQMAAAMYGTNPLDLHVQDAQAALDYLAARAEVDAERIGCLGNSTGGRMTMWLSIHDDRIRACVPSGCMNTFRERSLKLSSCGIQYPFGLLRHGDVPDLFCLLAPRPMQLQAGEGDTLITPAHRDDMARLVRRAYGLLGAQERLDYVLHDAGHLLDWPRAAPFLQRYLSG